MNHPEDSEVELIFFGPGFGECILAHLGSRNWIVIDSCLDDNREPAALSYLASIGVDVATEVKLVVATHWHDDHVKGMSKVIDACKSADFAISNALTQREFVAFLFAYDDQPETNLDRGGTELLRCLKILTERKQRPSFTLKDRNLIELHQDDLAHGEHAQVQALSPSDAVISDFLLGIKKNLESISGQDGGGKKPKTRLHHENKNDLSVATVIKVGKVSILLGADVEERKHKDYGWTNIVDSRSHLKDESALYKVAHHGSEGAHHEGIWANLLCEDPIAVITPWQLGSGRLPKDAGISAIAELSSCTYLTSAKKVNVKAQYERQTIKLITAENGSFSSNIYVAGNIAIKFDPKTGEQKDISLRNGAKKVG